MIWVIYRYMRLTTLGFDTIKGNTLYIEVVIENLINEAIEWWRQISFVSYNHLNKAPHRVAIFEKHQEEI